VDLYDRSIGIILGNQTSHGAYLASPNFSTYRYSWFRDGSYIAYAMNLVGEHDSAAKFHEWVAATVNARAATIRRAVVAAERGSPLTPIDILHTRYTAEGDEAAEDWPNFQLDGFGTWLWALKEHTQRSGRDQSEAVRSAAGLIADYLTALWARPCYDCWEEFPDNVHPHTLAAIYGGLAAHQASNGVDHRSTLASIVALIESGAGKDGHFVKFHGSDVVDASLLGLAVPYRVVEPSHPMMLTTAAQIEATLRTGGGVHRYLADTFYGGGEWVLLTCWLAWYYFERGSYDEARTILRWVVSQATEEGYLPEQVPENLNDPSCYEPWHQRWGDIATPLLWSHAMYLVCETLNRQALESAKG